MYLLETERRNAAGPTEEEFEGASAVLARVHAAADDLQFLLVADVRNGVDRGNFIIWLQGDRALVRLDEHRDHHATDPGVRDRAGEAIRFGAREGSFEVSFARSVSRTQALEALAIWVHTGQRSPSLEWS